MKKNFSTFIKNSPIPMEIYLNYLKQNLKKNVIGKNPLEFVLREYYAIISNRCSQITIKTLATKLKKY